MIYYDLKKPPTFMIIKRNAYKYVVNLYEYKLYTYYCTQEFRFCNLQFAIFFK